MKTKLVELRTARACDESKRKATKASPGCRVAAQGTMTPFLEKWDQNGRQAVAKAVIESTGLPILSPRTLPMRVAKKQRNRQIRSTNLARLAKGKLGNILLTFFAEILLLLLLFIFWSCMGVL